MIKKFRICIAILITIIGSFCMPAPAHAVVMPAINRNVFHINSFEGNYYLYRDDDGISRMIVEEEIVAYFPATEKKHGLTRTIPFTNQNGKNLTMESDSGIKLSVKRNGIKEPVSSVEIGDGYYTVYIGEADKYVTGEQTYDLIYEFENVITDFNEWQELYWDTNGNDWTASFDELTARVYFDQDIANNFTGEISCYVGKYGESGQERCKTTKLSGLDDEFEGLNIVSGVEFSTTSLKARENLTFDIQFEPNTFKPAPKRFDYRMLVAAAVAIIMSIVTVVLIYICLKATKEKRAFYKGIFVKPEYIPLHEYTVAEMATNYIGAGASGDQRVATLLDLAVNHKIELVKTEEPGLFGKTKDGWMVRIKSDVMNKQQANVLKLLAGSKTPLHVGQEIHIRAHTSTSELQSLAENFGKYVENNLETKGLKVPKPKKGEPKNFLQHGAESALTTVTIIYTVLFIIGLSFVFGDVPSYMTVIGLESPIFIMLIIVIPAISIVCGFVASVKVAPFFTHTQKGLEVSKYTEGLRMYMKMAEAERLKMLQSVKGADTTHEGVVKIYEKLLPYAVIFRLEKSWLDELGRYYEFNDVTPPTWYLGVGVFSAREFSTALNSMSTAASNTIMHSSGSNSSSGFSGGGGGGFSGGGGGGGGGGSW